MSAPFPGTAWTVNDSAGNPVSGAKIYTYEAGTLTAKAVYTSSALTTAASNPVICDASGRAQFFMGSGSYRFRVFDSSDVELTAYAADNISGDVTASLAESSGASLVGFMPSGTGAVTSTVQTKLREWVSVKDFGAVGDGTTDDTAAFVAALAAHDFVYVPPVVGSSYRITSTITITGTKTLAGPDGGSQAFQHTAIYHDPSATGELFNVTSSEQQGVCIRNMRILGGNGTWAIKSSRSYCRYEFLHMEVYTGGGIQLLSTGIGSSSSKLINCQWVGPASATAYTAYEIDVSGGDVWLYGCTAIRGAIGINIIQGQTIIIDKCSLNKQTRSPNVSGGPYSSATQFNTAGIKLTGTGYKDALSIRNCYLEALDNAVYVESCESLTIEDNLFQDVGAAGNGGVWTVVGNSAINLVSSAAKNVTIKNNRFVSNSNGASGDPFYGIYFNDAANVLYLNNYYEHDGDYSGEYSIGSTDTVYKLGNRLVVGTGTPVASVDASGKMRDIVTADQAAWVTPALTSPWTCPTSTVKYKRDALGFVALAGAAEGGSSGSSFFTLPVGYRPAAQQSYLVNASGSAGVVTVATSGAVSFTSGTGTYVYLSDVRFSTV